jgi:predicted nucleotide-binding protein
MQNPGFEWYAAKSREMNGPKRCPFASANLCPRYYESLYLLGDVGITTKISEETKVKLDSQWKKFEATIGEEAASISGGADNSMKAMSNFCPEVNYNIFGFFASGLYPHHGEIDRGIAYEQLAEENALAGDHRWNWASLTPRHYAECPEYSILQSERNGNSGDQIMSIESSQTKKSTNTKCVFVVHGRNTPLRDSMFAFLRATGLQPLEWSQAVKATGEGSPYIGHVLDTAFSMAQAIVVLMTPDDEARLRKEFHSATDDHFEKQLTAQARPNVLFEAGMAMGRDAKRTVLVQVGHLRPFSDISGRHVLRLKNSSPSRQELADRLRTAGCDVDLSGTDWHNVGSFEYNAQQLDQPNEGSQPKAEQIAEKPIISIETLLLAVDVIEGALPIGIFPAPTKKKDFFHVKVRNQSPFPVNIDAIGFTIKDRPVRAMFWIPSDNGACFPKRLESRSSVVMQFGTVAMTSPDDIGEIDGVYVETGCGHTFIKKDDLFHEWSKTADLKPIKN